MSTTLLDNISIKMVTQQEFVRDLKSIINEKTTKVKFDLYQVVSNQNNVLTLRKYYEKSNAFEVINTGIGLGNNKGFVTGYYPGDLLICMNMNGELFIITSLFNDFNATKHTKINPLPGEMIAQSIGLSKLKLKTDGSFKLFNKDNYGIECDASGNITIRGLTINQTQTKGTW